MGAQILYPLPPLQPLKLIKRTVYMYVDMCESAVSQDTRRGYEIRGMLVV